MTSSSGESTTPLDFHISSSCEDSSKLIIYTEDCPLCLKGSRNFYCKDCVLNGEFVHSNGISSEKFSDKKIRLLNLMKEKFLVEKACENALSARVQFVALMGEKEVIEERIKILKLLIDETKKSTSDKKQMVSSVKGANAEQTAKLLRYRSRIQKLKSLVSNFRGEGKKENELLIQHQEELKKERRSAIKQLVSNIFPISSIEPSGKQIENIIPTGLEGTCRTAFIQGKLATPELFLEKHYCIVAPSLPASGDYSGYDMWLEKTKPDKAMRTNNYANVAFNPIYRISAALTYTTQLIIMLAHYLDVWLPARLDYGEFCGNELNKIKLTKKIARLNWNVLHLCLSQNVEPGLLKPECALTNILWLLDQTVCDLGRSSTPDLKPEESRILEDSLRPSLEVDDTDDSGDECLSHEWEAVPTSNGLPESEPVHVNKSQQVSSTSVTGGLITSTAQSLATFFGWNR